VTSEELARWVAEQDTAALRGTTHAIPVSAGDPFLCPAQVPHAIGEGILLLELQEPTDFSILLESKGFTDPDDGHLGLGYDTALRAVDRESWSPEKLARLHVDGDRILPPAADPFFRAEWCRGRSSRLEAGFGVLVVTEGAGELRTAAGASVPLETGSTTLIPYAAGECTVDGELTAIHCRPPAAP
jgi:mannose-6-phosphate isomerase